MSTIRRTLKKGASMERIIGEVRPKRPNFNDTTERLLKKATATARGKGPKEIDKILTMESGANKYAKQMKKKGVGTSMSDGGETGFVKKISGPKSGFMAKAKTKAAPKKK